MIIGVTGFKGSGKDTASDIIADAYGLERYAFADPLKNGTAAFFGWTKRSMHDPKNKEEIDGYWGVSRRQVLQWLGTEVMRDGFAKRFNKSPDFWIECFTKWHAQQLIDGDEFKGVVVSDCRYQNEVDAIHNLNGVVIRVDREIVRPTNPEHASENIDILTGIDLVIPNNMGIEDLRLHTLEAIKAHFPNWHQPELGRI